MHTFKKETDGTYAVGQWLVGGLEFKFMPMFYVADRQNAISAINALNGADLTAAPLYPDFHVVSEHEPKKRSGKGTFVWTSLLIGLMIGIAYGCTRANADQRTIYGSDGKVIGRSTTDSQGTTTLYGRDGKALTRESPRTGGSTIYDAQSGRQLGTTQDKRK